MSAKRSVKSRTAARHGRAHVASSASAVAPPTSSAPPAISSAASSKTSSKTSSTASSAASSSVSSVDTPVSRDAHDVRLVASHPSLPHAQKDAHQTAVPPPVIMPNTTSAEGKNDHKKAEGGKKAEAKSSQKQHKKLHRQSLQEYLEKAGYEKSADALRHTIKVTIIGILTILSIVLLGAGIVGTAWSMVGVGLVALWSVGFGAVWLVFWACIYFFLDYRIYQRTKELEAVLPDFLQLASSNIAAGMPIDRALWYAIRPNFGVLAKEMEDVAKATMAGEDLEVSLVRMTNKYDSIVLKRSINILIEGLHAGGEMADLLNKIALNIEEMKIMKKEMAASVTTYAIFITFASVAIAPILFALATELLSIIIKITGSLDLSTTSSMLTMAAPSADAVSNFKLFSILMLIVLTVFSAAIVSVIRRGTVIEGVKTMPIYATIAIIIYFIASRVLHAAFGSII